MTKRHQNVSAPSPNTHTHTHIAAQRRPKLPPDRSDISDLTDSSYSTIQVNTMSPHIPPPVQVNHGNDGKYKWHASVSFVTAGASMKSGDFEDTAAWLFQCEKKSPEEYTSLPSDWPSELSACACIAFCGAPIHQLEEAKRP